MKTHMYSASFLNNNYTLYFSTFSNLYLNVKCITLVTNSPRKDSIQCFSYPDVGKTVVSYTKGTQTKSMLDVLYVFLMNEKLPLPMGLHMDIDISENIEMIQIIHIRTYLSHDYITYSTHTYSFRIYIKENPYNYTINVGGKDFTACLEIFIDKPDNPFYNLPKLQQVYSEPECWQDLGHKGNTVDLIKGSLQLCQMLFGVSQFYFEDASQIECGTTNMSQAPPRKFETPLSLAHLTLAKYAQTWYETNFNAFLRDPTRRNEYQKAVHSLLDDSKKNMDFKTMAQHARLNTVQIADLESLYTTSNSWRDFFSSIPKNKQCDMFLKWLPHFLDEHVLQFQPTRHQWCIWLDSLNVLEEDRMPHKIDDSIQPMERTDLYIEMEPEYVGALGGERRGRRRQNTRSQCRKARKESRKRKEHILRFSSS